MSPTLRPGGPNPRAYTLLLLFIAGMGGFLYGYDIGIIGAALLFLGHAISLTLSQESLIVAAVLGGGMISSLVAGALADLIGRKKVMVAAGLIFAASVVLIVAADGFLPLFLGRALQGLGAGMIAVVIPLYLAECLPASIRGRGTAAFQLLLTVGILISLGVGSYYTRGVEALSQSPASGAVTLAAAQDHAWRAMFLSALYPGIIFLAGSFFVTESPRWLFRQGRLPQALAALQRSREARQADREFAEMGAALEHEGRRRGTGGRREPLGQRKYVLPFALACAVLGLNQATGINSILQFIVVILQHAGLSAGAAALQGTWITAVNVVFTIAGLMLVDKLGRTALLKIGTAGITLALLIAAFVFHRFESRRVDVTAAVSRQVAGRALHLAVDARRLGLPPEQVPSELVVLYAYGGREKLASGFSRGAHPTIDIAPDPHAPDPSSPLTIRRAKFGPVPSKGTGAAVMACLTAFMAAFAIGPGVCVWLALSELMPTRIRSLGMGIGLLINQGISTAIAALFLPFVGNYGYSLIFLFWAACTAVYFCVSAFLLPETKGKTLEEIEAHFERSSNKV